MKTVYLVRHAKTAVADGSIPDKERKLVETGINNVKSLAGFLLEKNIAPELILSSDASRALETAGILAEKLMIEKSRIIIKKEIYGVDKGGALLKIIQKQAKKIDSVMMIGHNPSISALAHMLVKPFLYDLPTSGILGVECEVSEWSDIVPGRGRIRVFSAPLKKKKVKKLKIELSKILGEKLEAVVNEAIGIPDNPVKDKTAGMIRKKCLKSASELMKMQHYPFLKSIDEIALYFEIKAPPSEVKE